jgi:hypothetical protein
MPINANLLNALARPVRSVQDYQDDYDRQDIRAQGLQRNALMMQQAQQDQEEQQRAMQEQRMAQNALMQEVRGMPPPQDNPRLQAMHRMVLAGGGKPMDYLNEAYPAQPKPSRQVVGGSLVEVAGDGAVKELYKAPEKKQLPPEIVQLIDYSRSLQPGDPRKGQIEQAIQKHLTHAPGTTVNTYGSPVPFNLPDGSIGYAQPGNRAGAAPQVMTAPDGKPLTKPAGNEAAPTEDERKAAGWVSQAENAWSNMRAAAFDARGNIKQDAKPAALEMMAPTENAKNFTRSPGRQKFVQAASSMSEALLRAATGAGVNKEEADQKVRELTPQPFDSQELVKQKMDAIPPYLASLRTRANRALPKGLDPVAPVPSAGASAPKAVKFLGFE